jgi:hypothetical protein
VIIFTEIAMGLFLMESLRITRLFPVISTLDDQMRRRMIWVSAGILFTLACVESSLAYMRDLLAADREALTQSLAGIQVAQAELRWIPSVGQMILGFMLPFSRSSTRPARCLARRWPPSCARSRLRSGSRATRPRVWGTRGSTSTIS